MVDNETLVKRYEKELMRCIKHISVFLKPIEENWTGAGLPTLFSWIAMKTGAGVIVTAPMGAGKTLVVKLVDFLMRKGEVIDIVNDKQLIYNLQEFKKTDWILMFPAFAERKTFHFSIPEISAMPEYSQEFFWSRIPAFQSDGEFLYCYGADNSVDENAGKIEFKNCKASYIIASQPVKTYNIINDTTFKTLANDRCWNILLINQLKGLINVNLNLIDEKLAGLNVKKYTKILLRKTSKFKSLPAELTVIRNGIEHVELTEKFVKFENGSSSAYKDKADHVTASNLDISKLIMAIRNQYSVNRRDEQINDILKEFCVFLNTPVVQQVHVDLFVTLFSFYINLFNQLTIGSVEDSIKIKYGAVEMLGRISALISKNQFVTVDLLKKEFNSSTDDVTVHLRELTAEHCGILKERIPIIEESKKKEKKKKLEEKTKRASSDKSNKTVTRSTKTLKSVGLLTQRFATKLDTEKNAGLKPRQSIYEFTGKINNHFEFYAAILNDTLPKSVKKNIPQVERFLNRSSGGVA